VVVPIAIGMVDKHRLISGWVETTSSSYK
jgi:hypothetical protein